MASLPRSLDAPRRVIHGGRSLSYVPEVAAREPDLVRRPRSIGFWRWAVLGFVDFTATTAYAQEPPSPPRDRQTPDGDVSEDARPAFQDELVRSAPQEPLELASVSRVNHSALATTRVDDGAAESISFAPSPLTFSPTEGSGTRFDASAQIGQGEPPASRLTAPVEAGSQIDGLPVILESATGLAADAFEQAALAQTQTSTSSSATDVDEVADTSLSFTSGDTASALESVTPADVLYTAATSDEDTVGTVSYSLTDSDGGRFTIDPTSGEVTLAADQTLDYEQAHSHSFTVRAYDGANETFQTVTLAVTDVNDTAPVFESGATASALESVTETDVLYTAVTSDEDTVGTITYRLTDSDGGRFTIDPTTGEVTLATDQTLDYEQSDSHSFTVRAYDGANETLQVVTLAVTDVNDVAPVFESGDTASALESVTPGDVLYTATTSDEDTVGTVSYSLTDSDSGRFTIDPTTGEVTLAADQSLDYEQADSHSFTVRAYDGANATLQTVTLAVTDLNDVAPVFESGDTASAAESVTETDVLYTATTSDEDTVGTATYSLTDSDGGRFTIDATTGEVTLATDQSLDYEQADSHSFTVRAYDGANETLQTVTLAVTDVNDTAPVFESGDTASAAESVTETDVLYTAVASDEDTVGTVSYSLTDSDGGRFAIDATTGEVTLAADQTLDYELADSHSFTVRAYDGANETLQTVTLAVTDVNDVAPVFESGDTASALESVTPADVLYTATTSDEDTVGTVSYSLTDSDGGRFTIDPTSGEVTLAADQSLDYEQSDSHSFTVRAYDGANETLQTVTLAVTDVNEAPTAVAFTNVINLPENTDTSTGVKVADILVTDDALGTETLQIDLLGTDSGSFEIRNGFELYFTGASPDFESQEAYDVSVSVVDTSIGGMSPIGADLQLAIDDVNEAPTAVAFTNVISLSENTDTSSGVKVADILVTDDALGTDTLQLDLLGADAGSFEIRNDFELYFTGASPNFEAKDAYDVSVSVVDTSIGGMTPITSDLSLSIEDVNEAPITQNDVNGDDQVIEELKVTALNINPGDPDAYGNVLGNDSDPDAGDHLTVVGVAAGTAGPAPTSGAGVAIVGTYGSLTVMSDGSWHYELNNADPDTNALGQISQPPTGQDVFTYAVSDDHMVVSTATVTITIQGSLDLFGF